MDVSQCITIEDLMEHWKAKAPYPTSYSRNNTKVDMIINHQSNFFIPDGIVDKTMWKKIPQGKRILFIMKEAYEKDHSKASWSINEELREHGPSGSIWNRVCEWSYGILNTTTDSIPKYQEIDKESANEYIRKVAVMNVKKSDGKPNSVGEEISAYADADSAEIIREIELIDPDIIVCGYTFSDINRISGRTVKQGSNENWFYYTDAIGGRERLFLDYYHPANQYPKLLNYYGIVGIYQQALIEKTTNGSMESKNV